jgi:hypothetical protein
MKTWIRANRRSISCGLCGEVQDVGAPIVEYQVRGVVLIRCAGCEGGAPPDLPLIIERQKAPLPTLNWSRLGLLPLDFKTRAAVEDEREPGEEG